MPTTILSARGQIVIPAEVRRAAGFRTGDRLAIEVSGDDATQVVLRKKETLDELSDRLSRYVKPGTPPLTDVHGFYNTRQARV